MKIIHFVKSSITKWCHKFKVPKQGELWKASDHYAVIEEVTCKNVIFFKKLGEYGKDNWLESKKFLPYDSILHVDKFKANYTFVTK